MRLLLCNPYYHPFQGGIEARLHGTARGLAKQHEVAVLTAQLPGTAKEERREGYTILRVPAVVLDWFPYNPPPLVAWGIEDAIRAYDPDIFDFHYRWAPEWSRAFFAHAARAPAVFTWHNPYGEGTGWVRTVSEWNDARFLAGLGPVRRVITISEAVARDLATRGVPRAKLRAIHAGFDPAPPIRAPRADFALFVGRLVETKGLDVLLDALPLAPGVRVVLAGKGPALDGLVERARKNGVADRVQFRGFVPEAEKQRLMGTARFIVHPARWEGLGHALAEAMLHGTPVLATDVGGIPEAVGPGGVLVKPEDPKALAEGMTRLWNDGGLREALGAKALQHARGFSWERCVAETERVYREAKG